MNDFYELARSRGFLGDAGGLALGRARKTSILDFVEEASEAISVQPHDSQSHFGFMATTPLSGGASRCIRPQCRIEAADKLARFAALYADHVRIRNPFPRHSRADSVEVLRLGLAGDIAVMERLEPLIRAGIVVVNPCFMPLCAHCASLFEAQRERLEEILDAAGDQLIDQFLDRVTIKKDTAPLLSIRGPSSLVSHGHQYLAVNEAAFKKRLTRKRRKELLMTFVEPMLADVFDHHIHSRHSALNYLTDSALDLTIIRALGGSAIANLDRAVSRGLAHSVPVVMNAPIETILKLRKEEGESFAVYRHAIASIVRRADLSSSKAIEQAFSENIEPELARMDLAVRNAHKFAKRGLNKEVSVSAAAVSIGVLLGVVRPTLGAVLTALGGLNAISSLGGKIADQLTEPAITRENSFYFLWKLQRAKR